MKKQNNFDLNSFNVQSLSDVELIDIEGGDWITRLGASVGDFWCEVKGVWKSSAQMRGEGFANTTSGY
jgi:hypothetical protein